MEAVETIEYKNHTIKIVYDEEPLNPREDWDNLGKMICFHGKYNLGDKHDFKTVDDFKEFLQENKDAIVVLPLYLYDHSGITMKTIPFSCPWDSGQVGCIYADYKSIQEWLRIEEITEETIVKVKEILESEVETFDDYITGGVYGYIIEDADENEIDSCYGFYGDYKKSGILDEAKSIIDHCIEEDSKKMV